MLRAIAPQSFRTVVVENAENNPEETQAQDTVVDSFDAVMGKVLQANRAGNVSEEDLFSALIYQRIDEKFGSEVAEQYRSKREQFEDQFRRPDGRTRVEDAARSALAELQTGGAFTLEEADAIHSESFSAAQLDGNLNALYDGYAGPNDTTKAVATLEAALLGARVKIEEIGAGAVVENKGVLTTRSNTVADSQNVAVVSDADETGSTPSDVIAPAGTTIDGPDGFLFKPISENQKKLAILLPAELTGSVLSVILRASNGDVVEEGVFIPEGTAETGRQKYNFSRKGANYPDDITVEVRLADGSMREYQIPDPSKRYD
jgi:hypothetical protein